jgi:glycosyltransferase involved in cell wall biosynthesis
MIWPMQTMVEDSLITFSRLRSRVCVGMCVRNAQALVGPAIESVLSQTFADLELVISDNASHDATPEICQRYARRDKRVSLTRLARPIDEAANLARVYALCGGQYFKWMSAAERLDPEFIARCVGALDADPAAVLACPRGARIDAGGRSTELAGPAPAARSALPHLRFAAVLNQPHSNASIHASSGLMRRSAIDLVPLPGDYPGADRAFVARLALCGRLVEVAERLSIVHELSGNGTNDSSTSSQFPHWRLLGELLGSVRYGWLNTGIRAMCIASVLRRELHARQWTGLIRDLASAGQTLARRIGAPSPAPTPEHGPFKVRTHAQPRPVPSKAAA